MSIQSSLHESMEKLDQYMQESSALADREDLSEEEKNYLDDQIFEKMEAELAIVEQKQILWKEEQKQLDILSKKRHRRLVLSLVGVALVIGFFYWRFILPSLF